MSTRCFSATIQAERKEAAAVQLDPITRAVLDAMQEGVLIIDAQERIVYGLSLIHI